MKKIKKYIENLPSLEGKKIIITGANSGLGFAMADVCLSKGAKVVFACRNANKAAAAIDNLHNLYPNSEISLIIYDQSSLASCRKFVDEIFDKHSDFFGLVLNAGVFNCGKGKMTGDGYPMVTGTNSYGLAAILDQIQVHLDKINDEKRIVIQGSLAALLSKYKNLKNSTQNPNGNHFCQYNISKKMCLNLYNFYAQNNTSMYVKYLYCEPGISKTNIIRNYSNWFRKIADLFMKICCQSALEGCLPAMELLCKKVSNATAMRPKLLFAIRGLPKERIINKKHLVPEEMPALINCTKVNL